MIHFCSDVVANPRHPFDIDKIYEIYAANSVSAHYFIDRQGVVLHAIPDERVAYHAGKGTLSWRPDLTDRLNDVSIGIELLGVGSPADMAIFMPPESYEKVPAECLGFSDAQYGALKALIRYLCERYPDIKEDRRHVIGHSEYAAGRRTDPGSLFQWERLELRGENTLPRRSSK